jgi:CelD/BcsL family acetyltransferase involved in cellulose biosynthesis
MLLVPEARTESLGCVSLRLASASDVPEGWAELAANASEPNAFHEPWFLKPALTHLASNRDIRLAEARDAEGRLVGLLPLTLYSRYGRMPARHTSNWMHYQCFMGAPLVEAEFETAFWQTLLSALDASEWAEGFLSITGLLGGGAVHRGLEAAAATMGRPAPTVHSYDRAALSSDLDAEAYLESVVRGKKRKELRRLANRLRDEGTVAFRILDSADQIDDWASTFLSLEAAGWKGERGAAFGNAPETDAFFREVVRGAFAAGKLDFQRLDLDGRAIAMLVNFRTPPGSWSFKIAYDETLARFSPGVLIELENLPRVLGDPEIEWMDSCAVENHPMINSLWAERRRIVQVSVPLAGASRRMIYNACRAAETGSAQLRRLLGKNAW